MRDMMQMRNIIKNGALYRLSSVNTVEDSAQGSNQISSFEKISGEQDNDINRPKPQQLTKRQKRQNAIAAICGGLFGLITTLGGIYLIYIYVFEGILKHYIPFLRSSQIFLTENIAKEYFERFPIYAGEIHYSKIPVQYWEHRIKMVKSMGLNSITISIFWNYHQISKGIFDFSTQNKNLTKFLEIAKNENLRVIVRTGPYVNSEQDFGGLPERILSIKNMQVRSSNNQFVQQTKIYVNELMKILRPFIQNSQNPQGSIILLEIQHESGQLNDQTKYIKKLKQLWNQLKPGCPLFYSDNEKYFSKNMISGQNVIIGINIQQYKNQIFNNLDKQKAFFFTVNLGFQILLDKNTSYDSSQYIEKITNQFSDILSDKRSFSMNIHTKNNTATSNKRYFPIMNENGSPTQIYHIFRSIFANYTNTTLPSIPQKERSQQNYSI